jgi:DNA-binding GntR family transcriptional regulator
MDLDSYVLNLPLHAPKASETISRLLRQAIVDGALPGGTFLRQEEIAKKFGVSRVPVREAFHKLEGEGLVHTEPRRGVVVTPLVAEDFEEILDMRLALESVAIDIAARRFSQEDLDAVMKLADQAEQGMLNLAGSLDFHKEFESRWGDLNWKFHRRIYEVAQRPRMLSVIESLHEQFARHLRARIADPASLHGDAFETNEEQIARNLAEWAVVMEEHRQLALACARHDGNAAKSILQHHISDHGTELVRRLRVAMV